MEVEAVDEGVVEAILVPEGTEEVKVNTPIARLKGGEAPAPRRPPRPQSRRPRAEGRRAAARAEAAPERDPRPWPLPAEGRRRRVQPASDGAVARRAAADPEIPAGTPSWSSITVRDALRDAMAEEMRRDRDVFLMGEEVAQYQGAYKVSRDLLEEFGDQAGDRHPDHRARLRRPRRRRGDGGPEADRRVHDLQLRHAGDRPDHQFGGQDPLHVRRPDAAARSCSAARTAPPRASPPSTARTTPAGTPTCRA